MLDTIKKVEQKIEQACIRSGRNRNEVKLVAVSKTHPAQLIHEAYETGLRTFGESRAQEFRDKITVLPKDIEWHFIGHLQRNKIKYVAGNADLIHSVDSVHLAKSISEYAVSKSLTVSILMEVNTSAEETKYGLSLQEATETFSEISEMSGIHLKGLMTMAPFVDDEKLIRSSFEKLRRLKEELSSFTDKANIVELSMGMSQDFEFAIEEGSTLVRVGTAIFGSREVM